MNAMKQYSGGCHCGAVTYDVSCDLSSTITCNCSICEKSGTILTFVSAEKFQLKSGEEDLTDYQFNTKKIHHLFCKHCGVRSFARGKDTEGKETLAINVRCLDDVALDSLKPQHFNGKDL